MNVFKLVAGLIFALVFAWLLYRHVKHYGFGKSILSLDIFVGLAVGVYLIVDALLAIAR